ncbi:MAG: galactokinase [Ferruginibacter sp.]
MIHETVLQIFKERFQGEPIIIRSPGRINIIGEHTDYNDGFVMPAAIDKAVYMAIFTRSDNEVHLYAADFKEAYSCRLDEVKPLEHHWANYILGVIDQVQQLGHNISGFNAVIAADLPIGAGISSSAALECATAMALNGLFTLKLEKMEMVKLAQKAEHRFAGVMCGIMDMFASMMGKRDHCIKLDCRSLEYEYEPLVLKDHVILLFNTNVKHSLASSAYNKRREECAAGVKMLQQYYPQVHSLRDASLQMLDEHVLPFEPMIYRRCRFIVQEIQRLQDACADLQKGDIDSLGKRMFATHDGLSKDYEVSCAELDYLVQAVRNDNAVLGARMMGGGFGGCTINIVRRDGAAALTLKLTAAYKRDMQKELSVYEANISDGTSVV